MKKWICTVCGYVHEGEQPPEKCPQCGVPADKFKEQVEGEKEWAAEHVVGVAKGVSEDILADLRANFEGECSELGEVVTDSTKKNLEMRVDAEHGATEGKFDLAKRAKAANLDAIHDTVHEMARDEARHGKAFEGLLKRYFG